MSTQWFASRALRELLAFGLVAMLAPSPAFAAPESDPGIVSSRIPEQQAQAATEFWTPQRMKQAKPAMPTLRGKPRPSGPSAQSSPSGPAVKINPAVSASHKATEAPEASEAPVALHATTVSRPYTEDPDRLNGKVFFTSEGGLFMCSGTVINSENKSIVWTAGHCVHEGQGGKFHKNWMFVPAYSSSSDDHRPYGTWTARELLTRAEWASNSNFRQDLGAAVVKRLDKQRIVDVLGGQGIAFNQPRSQRFSAFGYPAAPPFNGFLQWRCNSRHLDNDFPTGIGSATLEIHCNMTGGSSGGGWLIDIGSNGLGLVNGLNSYRYGSTPDNLFGPYHGDEALRLYNAAQNRPA
ncbi:MAG: hypothetical protein ACRDYA_02795 [Egibacteraceae bacterium]